ncbi:MAG: hypothetical protein IT287_09975, partial [Bdellovibrionaceae bacterium]|nr:hypothetical protein [Pseudobdellovibrionaceae bacterium]
MKAIGIVFSFLLFVISCSHMSPSGQDSDKALNDFLDTNFDEAVEKSPEFLTQLGIKKHYGK